MRVIVNFKPASEGVVAVIDCGSIKYGRHRVLEFREVTSVVQLVHGEPTPGAPDEAPPHNWAINLDELSAWAWNDADG